MTERTVSPGSPPETSSVLDAPFRVVVVMTLVLVVLVATVGVRGALAPGPSPTPAPTLLDTSAFLYARSRPAPGIALTDQDGAAFSLTSVRGTTTLVFFGYTHCPDVCPATMGIIGQVLAASSDPVRAVFVTVDPERDTVPYLKEYVRYLQAGVTAVTGTPSQIRTVADDWGVRYARVESGTAGVYSMSHTAEVYAVDATGELRGHFPFGTQADAMLATIRAIVADAPTAELSAAPATSSSTPSGSGGSAGPSPSPGTSPVAPWGPVADLAIETVSSSVWAGGSSPVILRIRGPEGPISDQAAVVSVQLAANGGGRAVGPPVNARAVQPPGVATVSYVAILDIPGPGWWDLAVTVSSGGTIRTGTGSVSAQAPGTTAALGASAPTVRTPTLGDAGGLALKVTTDPVPDLRMSQRSTTDALAAGTPFVLVIDSVRFRVTPVCGKAVALAKYLLDRWANVAFVHLEPYAYSIISDTAVIDGSLAAPTLVPAADGWGIGGAPWGAGSMPWVFVVDGHGIVRAKYQGIVGSDDVDVMLSLLASGG